MEVPEEWELVSFFESDPLPTDPDEREFFGGLAFARDVGGGDVLHWSFSVPFRDMRLTLVRDATDRVVLVAREVASIRIERFHGVETLVAVFGRQPALQRARLTLRPSFRIEWGLET